MNVTFPDSADNNDENRMVVCFNRSLLFNTKGVEAMINTSYINAMIHRSGGGKKIVC